MMHAETPVVLLRLWPDIGKQAHVQKARQAATDLFYPLQLCWISACLFQQKLPDMLYRISELSHAADLIASAVCGTRI